MSNNLLQVTQAGQAIWLDYVERDLVRNGGLKRLIEQDGVTGVTSNPSIFEKAIGTSEAYDEALAGLARAVGEDPEGIYERLAIEDIQAAADLLRPVYDRLETRDGYVSLEVSPHLAMDAGRTVDAARRLWRAVSRPNLMIKVPGTVAGCKAIRTLVSEGINVNVTLLFSLESYLAAAEAHIAGLEDLKAKGGDISRVAGVASLFVSRIDTLIDDAIDTRLTIGAGDDEAALKRLRGQVAIANAKSAYQSYLTMIASPRWRALAMTGAQPQRLLWASTGCKNPDYRDTVYVEALIGPDTVNTMPPKTLEAFRDHGVASASLTREPQAAAEILLAAGRLGLDLPGVTARLTAEGIAQFCDAAEALYGTIAARCRSARVERPV